MRFHSYSLMLWLFAAAPVGAAALQPPGVTIPAAYFGLTVESSDSKEKIAPGKSWRLWDSGVGWRDIQSQRGQWDFSRLDAFVSRAQQAGAGISYVFGMTPQWAAARPDEPGNYNLPGMASDPQDLNDWKTFVGALAQRYKGRIRQWELWNEGNDPGYYSGSVGKLVQMANVATAILKAADPGNVVLSPSVSPAGGAGLTWLDNYLASGGGTSADVINYHLYEFDGQPEDMVDLARQVKSVMARHGLQNKPLWNTESGWLIESAQHQLDPLSDVGPVLTAQQAADFIARAYVLNWAAGVGRFYWYAWDDNNFGLLETDGVTIKPAGRANQHIQQWLTGARMSACTQNVTQWTCSLVTATGKPALIAWVTNGSGTIRLPSGWPGAIVAGVDGSVRQVKGGASVTLSTSTVMITASGTTQVPISSPKPGSAGSDRTPPGVVIVSPRNGTVSGTQLVVSVRLSDNIGVVKVAYYFDGRLLKVHTGSRLAADHITLINLPSGRHHIQVQAFDAQRNSRVASVWVNR